MQLLLYQLALGLFRSLVMLFRPLRALPILCQLALGLFRSLVVLVKSLRAPPASPTCISRPNAAAVVPARPWPVPISGRLCHHPALADLLQLLWYQLAL